MAGGADGGTASARNSAGEGGRDGLSFTCNVIDPRAKVRRSTPRPKPGGGRGSLLRALCGLTAAGVLATGCQRETPATAAPQKPAATAPAARTVRVAPATEASVARTVVATGTLAADEQMVLGAKVVGRLSEISVDLGSPVRKGQPVARIDPTDYRHRLDQAIAALQQARARLGMTPDGADDRVDPDRDRGGAPGEGGARRGPAEPRPDGPALEAGARGAVPGRLRGGRLRGGRGTLPGRDRGSAQPPGRPGPAALRGRPRAPAARRHRAGLAHRRRGGPAPCVGGRVPGGRGAGGDARAAASAPAPVLGAGARVDERPRRAAGADHHRGRPDGLPGDRRAPVAGDHRAEPDPPHRGRGPQPTGGRCGPAPSRRRRSSSGRTTGW